MQVGTRRTSDLLLAGAALGGFRRIGFALDDPVDVEDLWGRGKLDPKFRQHGQLPQLLTERLELLARVPDLDDLQVAIRSKADVAIKAVGPRINAGFLKLTGAFVVGRGCQRGGLEADDDPHGAILHARAAGRPYPACSGLQSLMHDQGISWTRIGEAVGHRDIVTTARTCTHVLGDSAELDYAGMP